MSHNVFHWNFNADFLSKFHLPCKFRNLDYLVPISICFLLSFTYICIYMNPLIYWFYGHITRIYCCWIFVENPNIQSIPVKYFEYSKFFEYFDFQTIPHKIFWIFWFSTSTQHSIFWKSTLSPCVFSALIIIKTY